MLFSTGGFAGVWAATPDRSRYSLHDASVVLVAANDYVRRAGSLSRAHCRRDDSALVLDQLLEDSGATAVRATARNTDLANRRIAVEHPDGHSETIAYDILIYALGSTIDRGAVPGLVEHAFSVANEQSSDDLTPRHFKSRTGRQQMLVVCGGGMTGVELATEIAEAFPRLRVRLLSRDAISEPLAPRAREYLAKALASRHIEVDVGKTVREVRARELVLDDGTQPFDLCIWAASFAVSPLARSAGLAVHAERSSWSSTRRCARRRTPTSSVPATPRCRPAPCRFAWAAPPRCRWQPTPPRTCSRRSAAVACARSGSRTRRGSSASVGVTRSRSSRGFLTTARGEWS